jgi:catechol 2,3-dioxygenase-like lactoylglutathione lyase family enzyme
MTGPLLHTVHIGARDLAQAAAAYTAIVGVQAESGADAALQLRTGDAMVCLHAVIAPDAGAAGNLAPHGGIWAMGIQLDDAPERMTRWRRRQAGKGSADHAAYVDLRGVRIFVSDVGDAPASAPVGEVELDHVALMVRDLDAATQEWEDLTGLVAHRMAVHPASNGTLAASRFLLGPRMIELLEPIAGRASPLSERLAKVGEGPLAMALPARDLNATLTRLRGHGIGVVYDDPNWVVRPGSAAGVPIQLTPRVNH